MITCICFVCLLNPSWWPKDYLRNKQRLVLFFTPSDFFHLCVAVCTIQFRGHSEWFLEWHDGVAASSCYDKWVTPPKRLTTTALQQSARLYAQDIHVFNRFYAQILCFCLSKFCIGKFPAINMPPLEYKPATQIKKTHQKGPLKSASPWAYIRGFTVFQCIICCKILSHYILHRLVPSFNNARFLFVFCRILFLAADCRMQCPYPSISD